MSNPGAAGLIMTDLGDQRKNMGWPGRGLGVYVGMVDRRTCGAGILFSCAVLAFLPLTGAQSVRADPVCDDATVPVGFPCESSFFPICDGTCPTGQFCSAGDGGQTQCTCVVDPFPCDESGFPVCDGECPGGLTCIAEVDPPSCGCEAPPVACEFSTFPVCDGICDPGESCLAGAAGSDCACGPPPACEDAAFPECDGECRDGGQCAPIAGGDQCECLAPACQDSPFPVCDGSCPVDFVCTTPLAGAGGCDCIPCNLVQLPAEVTGFRWSDKIDFTWDPVACATAYNVYREISVRLIDADSDGVADSYGTCFLAGVATTAGADPSSPVSGSTGFYLVTGENASGEGPLGNASNGLPRPNTSPCP